MPYGGTDRAAVTAASDSARPAALRPTRPLPRTEACAAIACARSAGQPGKRPAYLPCERLREAQVLRLPPPRVPRPPPPSRLRVRQAPLLGPGERHLLDEDALPLVPAPPPVEAHHHRRQRAVLPRPARQRGVAPRQEHEVSQVRAVRTAWFPLLQHQQRQRSLACSTQRRCFSGWMTRSPPRGRGSCDRCHRLVHSPVRGGSLRDAAPFSVPPFPRLPRPPRAPPLGPAPWPTRPLRPRAPSSMRLPLATALLFGATPPGHIRPP